MRPILRTPDGPVRERLRKWPGGSYHPVTGAAQRWIQAENNRVVPEHHRGRRLQDRRRRAPLLDEALLHGIELLRRDAHPPDIACHATTGKGETTRLSARA